MKGIMDLKTINCVIAGVSGETGTAIRSALLQQGATVIGTSRQTGSQRSLVKHSDCDFEIQMDPTDPKSIQSTFNIITENFTQIHVWINIVGGFEMGKTVENYPEAAWDKMWNLNFVTVLNSSQIILPHFKKFQTGRLINFGSAAVESSMALAGPYLVSKAAVHMLTKAIASELSGDITCNAIVPGTIDTKSNRLAMPDADFSSWVSPETVAEQILVLLESSTTGELLQL